MRPNQFFLLNYILIRYVVGPNFRYKCDGRGVRACDLDGDFGGDPSSEVLRRGGLHLVVTEVVPVGDGADNNNNNKELLCCSIFERGTKKGLLPVCL